MINESTSFTTLPGSFNPESPASPDSKNAKSVNPKIRRVIGIDPGLANTGFGVVDFITAATEWSVTAASQHLPIFLTGKDL